MGGQAMFYISARLVLIGAGGLADTPGMSDTDAHYGFGLEVALYIENESGVEGNDIDCGMFSRVRRSCPAGGAELVQCLPGLAILEREHGAVVRPFCIQVDIE